MDDYGVEDNSGEGGMDLEMKRVMELSKVTAQNDELKRMSHAKDET